jgi:hypothetical protein
MLNFIELQYLIDGSSFRLRALKRITNVVEGARDALCEKMQGVDKLKC